MARGIAAVRDRIHALLTSTAGVYRPLTFSGAPLARAPEVRGNADQEEREPDYTLRWAGDPGFADRISGPVTSRVARFSLDVSVFAGGGFDGGSDSQQTDAILADIWEDVVQVLEDPNNRDYATSGWIIARNFVAAEPALDAGRMHMIGTFDIQYDVDLPTM